MRLLALVLLLVASPLAAQQQAQVTVASPPAQVDITHNNADTTVVVIDVTMAQAALDQAVAPSPSWLDPVKRNWPWLGLGLAALYLFNKKSFGSTIAVESPSTINVIEAAPVDAGEHHHFPPGHHR